MIAAFVSAWSVVAAVSTALWHSGFIVGIYGLELGKKVFMLHFTAELAERRSNPYSL